MILYEQNETDFFSLGLGSIKGVKKATVTQERNGSFILEATVTIIDGEFEKLKENRIIKADADNELKDQRFRIKRITPKHNGTADIYAEHVSYLSQELSLEPDIVISGQSASGALTTWKGSIIEDNPFVVDSDIPTTNSTKWRIDNISNPRQALGGVEGSILDVWGGEYLFDNYHISLLQKRGKVSPTILAYGRNITDLEQECNISNVYTSIYPYAIYTDDNQVEHLVTIDNYVVDSQYVGNYPNRNVLTIDFSSEFDKDTIPTNSRLKELADNYIKNNDIGIPKTSIKVSFLDLSKTKDYADIAPLEQVNLCDEVPIYYEKLVINTTAKVIRTVYNLLTETYDEIEVGEKRVTLSNVINDQAKAVKEIETQTWQAQASANGKNTIFSGLFGENGTGEPTATKVGDLWFKPNGTDTDMYQWNGTIWEKVIAGDFADKITERVSDNEQATQTALEKANQGVADAEQARADAGLAGQTAEGNTSLITTLRTDVDGKATIQQYNSLKSTVNGNVTTIGDLRNNKAEKSDVTQMATQFNIKVESLPLQGQNLIPFSDASVDGVLSKWGNSHLSLIKHSFYKNNSALLFALVNTSTTNKIYSSTQWFDVEPDTTYTLSFLGFASGNVRDMDVQFLSKDAGAEGSFQRARAIISNIRLSPTGARLYSTTFKTSPSDGQAQLRWDNNRSTDGNGAVMAWVEPMLVKGDKVMPYSPRISDYSNDITTQSQLSVLSDQINLRVQKNDIVNQINLSTEGILIAGKKIQITGETYIQNGVIKNAMIDSLSATKVNTGTLNAADVNIINLNASSITSGTFSGISYKNPFTFWWAGKHFSGETTISDGGITQYGTASDGTQLSLGLTGGGLRTQYGTGSTNISPSRIEFVAQNGTESLLHYSNSESVYYISSYVGSGLGAYRKRNGVEEFRSLLKAETDWADYNAVIMRGTLKANEINFPNGSFMYDNYNKDLFVSAPRHLYLRTNEVNVIDLDPTTSQIRTYLNIDMNYKSLWNVANITQTSDERLKTNITPTSKNGIEWTMKQRVVDYNWDGSNPVNLNKPTTKQFGIIAQNAGDFSIVNEQTGYLSVSSLDLINIGIKTDQEIIKKIQDQQSRIEKLEKLLGVA